MYIQCLKSHYYKPDLFHITSTYAHQQPSPSVRIRIYTHPSPSHPKHIYTRARNHHGHTHRGTSPRRNLPKLPPTRITSNTKTSDTCVDLCQPPTSARSVFSSLALLTLRWGVPHARFSTPVHHRGEGTWHGVGAQQTTMEQGEVTPFLLPPADRGHMLCVNDSVGARVALGDASPATRTRSFSLLDDVLGES